MRAKAQRWGNSLAIRIPKAIAEQTGIHENDELDIKVMDHKITLTPCRPIYQLEELLAQVTENNLHGEMEFGRPAGKEAW